MPVMSYGKTPDQVVDFYREAIRRIGELPGVDRVAVGTAVPWRDAGNFGPGFEFSSRGPCSCAREKTIRAAASASSRPDSSPPSACPSSPAAISTTPIAAAASQVVIVSQSLAQRMFPNQDAINRHLMWTDPVMKFIDISPAPRRIVGVAADVDDENIVPGPAMTVYHPLGAGAALGRPPVRSRARQSLRAGLAR